MNPVEPLADDTSSPRHNPNSGNLNKGDGIQSFGFILFCLAGIPFGLLSAFLLTWGMAWSNGSRDRESIINFVTCGKIYIIGSLICFRIRCSGRAILLLGIILNAIGAYIWVPGMSSLNGGSWFFLIPGLALLGCWMALMLSQATAPNSKSSVSPTRSK
jgi:hypothetical protein